MAYTSVIPVYRLDNAVRYAQDKQKTTRQHGMPLAETVDYALNREKTETDGFESGLGCTTQSAYEDMRANAVRWHKTDGVQGYHLVQSFAEGEVTPELAHKIGLELAERVLGGRHQAIVTTHLNTSHYHNHIVWSSVAMNSGRKYHSNAKSYALEIRAVSDELCVKYGLSIIQTERAAQVSKPYAEWLAEKNGQPTWRTVIRQDVDAALAEALTWRQFIRELESKGYELNFNHKYPTLRPPGKTRPVRFKTLGRQYTSEALQIRILYPDARWHFLQEQPPVAKHARLRKSYGKARRLTGLRALYYRYLYELGALPHKPRRPSYAVRQDIRNLDRRIRQMEFLSANSIDSIEQLQAKQIALENKIAELQTERQRLYRTAPNSPEIPAITAALKPLRRDLKLCKEIAAHSAEMRQRLADAERERQQEVREDDADYQSPLDILFERLEMREPDSIACKQYRIFKQAAGKTARSILVSVGVRLAAFNLPQIARLTMADELHLEELGERKIALFCCIPDSDKSLNYLVGMIYSQLIQTLYRQADRVHRGRLPVPVHLLIDEFPNISLPKDSFLSALATMRSRGIFCSIIAQNMAQLKAMYKNDWESLVGLCDEFLYLGGNEQGTHKYVSELIGKETISIASYNRSRGRNGSYSVNRQTSGRELLKPNEVRLLGDDKAILFVRGERPILDDKYDLLRHPNIRFTEDGGASPYDYTAAAGAANDLPGQPEQYELLDMDDFEDKPKVSAQQNLQTNLIYRNRR